MRRPEAALTAQKWTQDAGARARRARAPRGAAGRPRVLAPQCDRRCSRPPGEPPPPRAAGLHPPCGRPPSTSLGKRVGAAVEALLAPRSARRAAPLRGGRREAPLCGAVWATPRLGLTLPSQGPRPPPPTVRTRASGKSHARGEGGGDSVVTAGDPAKSGPSLASPRASARAAERVPAVKPRPPAVFLSPGHQQSPASWAECQHGPPPPAGARAPAGALRAGPLGPLSGDVGRPRGPRTRLWTVVLGGEGSHAPWRSRPPARHTHTLFPWLHPRLLPPGPVLSGSPSATRPLPSLSHRALSPACPRPLPRLRLHPHVATTELGRTCPRGLLPGTPHPGLPEKNRPSARGWSFLQRPRPSQ